MSSAGGAVKKCKQIVSAIFLQISKVILISDSMFVHHFGHKGPCLKARPLLMAVFYEFKAAVSDFF